MLILTRRRGETITIGDAIRVTVLGVDGNKVRLGVYAPEDISVHREEIHQRIKEQARRPDSSGEKCPASHGVHRA